MQKRKKPAVVKVVEGLHILSQHRLDLTGGLEKESSKKSKFFCSVKKSKTNLFEDLFIFSFIKIILFFPKLLFRGMRLSFEKVLDSLLSLKAKFAWTPKRHIFQRGPLLLDFSPPQSWGKGIAVFVLLAFVLVLPFRAFSSFGTLEEQKDYILEESLQGYKNLKNSDFTKASMSFASAQKTINDLGFVLRHLLAAIPGVGDKLSFGSGLLIFGENFAGAAARLQEAVAYFDNDVAMVEKIKHLGNKVDQALPNLLIANQVLEKLDDTYGILPIDLNPIKRALKDSVKALLVFQEFSDTLLDVLGDKHFKRYLVLFQNNNEIRPTGGFIGSFALVDVDRGEIKNIEIPGGGSYDIQGQLRELVISPEPFHLINSAWQFQDSNWFPDFPTSAEKIMWFYEKSGGSSVDGVVAINATLMEDLLALIGPVEMDEYGRIMTADNFIEETQKIVELEYDKEINKPKQVIADMAPKVLDKLLNIDAEGLSSLSEVLHQAILEKDLLVYSKNETTQKELEKFGLSGKLKDLSPFTDYLMLVDTNIAGQKTDGKIVKEIVHNSEIADDGSIINTVQITRRHTGIKGTLFSGVRNVNYLRLYVPQGSILLEASGFKAPPGDLFEAPQDGYKKDLDLMKIQGPVYIDPNSGTRINNEFNRTVFGNWIMVDPGQEVVVTFKYKLPTKISAPRQSEIKETLGLEEHFANYTMLVEKQPGAKNTFFKSRVKAEGLKAVARTGNGIGLQDYGWQYETLLDSDKFYGVVLED